MEAHSWKTYRRLVQDEDTKRGHTIQVTERPCRGINLCVELLRFAGAVILIIVICLIGSRCLIHHHTDQFGMIERLQAFF
jgi:hypothetical protein